MLFAENINRILGKGMSSWRWCTTSINRSNWREFELLHGLFLQWTVGSTHIRAKKKSRGIIPPALSLSFGVAIIAGGFILYCDACKEGKFCRPRREPRNGQFCRNGVVEARYSKHGDGVPSDVDHCGDDELRPRPHWFFLFTPSAFPAPEYHTVFV